jgi:sirohydrochlorin cobaltochelatase
MRGIVLFAHGSRDPEWASPFHEICRRIRAIRPECPAELAFLEGSPPTLAEAIDALAAEGASAVTVFPLFLGRGGHLKEDVRRLADSLRAQRPHIPIALEETLGEAPEVLDAVAAWILGRLD